MALFLYGTLRHGPLLRAVAGPGGETVRPARLSGYRTVQAGEEVWPALVVAPGAVAEGLLVEGLGAGQIARIDLYEGAFGYRRVAVEVMTEAGTRPAEVYLPSDPPAAGGDWSLSGWEGRWARSAVLAAEEIFAHDPPLGGARLLRQWPLVMARAEAAARAGRERAPAALRRPGAPGAADWRPIRPLAGDFFKFATIETAHDRFDGGRARGLVREILVGMDAALVLPYDPHRDRVVLIEQIRNGPLRRGDADPWCLEPVAGLVDAGETPEEAAVRECAEEAGVVPHGLIRMFAGYASPGSSTEFFHCFAGLVDLPDGGARFGGLASEAEDIRVHLLPADRAFDLIDSGEANVTPLVAMLLWLARARPRLRAEAGAA